MSEEFPKRLSIDRDADGFHVEYGGQKIENVAALSVSVSPAGVSTTIVFCPEEVDVSSAVERIIGCSEKDPEKIEKVNVDEVN